MSARGQTETVERKVRSMMPPHVASAGDAAIARGARMLGTRCAGVTHWRLTGVRGFAAWVLASAGWWRVRAGVWAWAAN